MRTRKRTCQEAPLGPLLGAAHVTSNDGDFARMFVDMHDVGHVRVRCEGNRSRVNMAHISQSRPGSSRGFQVKKMKRFKMSPLRSEAARDLASGVLPWRLQGYLAHKKLPPPRTLQ